VIVPTEAVQVTPALVESLVTVAVKVCVALAASVAVVGLTVTEIGVSVMVAVADLVVSVLLVAVTVADVVVMTAGAVYTPADVIEPVEAVQVTPALAVSFVTVAVKVCVAPPMSVAVAGLTVTLIAGAAEPPPHPTTPANNEMLNRLRTPVRERAKLLRLPIMEISGGPVDCKRTALPLFIEECIHKRNHAPLQRFRLISSFVYPSRVPGARVSSKIQHRVRQFGVSSYVPPCK
jgi:hypothetical protein